MPNTVDTYLLIALAYLTAGFVKGVTGLGFSTTCLPILVLAVGLKSAMPLLVIPSIVSNVIVSWQSGGVRPTLRRFWPMYLATVPGLVVGLMLLAQSPEDALTILLGVVIIAYGTFALSRPDLALRASLERPLKPVVGFLTGVVNGVTGSQLIPVLPFLLALHVAPATLLVAMNISFTVSSSVLLIGFIKLGLMTLKGAVISMAGLGCVFAGTHIGGELRKRMAPELFRSVVLITLIALGIVLIVKNLA